MEAPGALQLGRSAAAEHRWREACERLAEARSARAEGLSGPDLELLSTASFLRGRTQAAFDALISAHESYLAQDDSVGAARTAAWLALELLEAGDVSLAGTWIARGVRLAERLVESHPVGGLAALVPAGAHCDVRGGRRRGDRAIRADCGCRRTFSGP